MIRLTLLLLALPTQAAERTSGLCHGENGIGAKVTQACKEGKDLQAARQVKAHCEEFVAKRNEVDDRARSLHEKCEKAGAGAAKKSVKKSRGDQAVAEADVAAMAAEGKETMSKCAKGMGEIGQAYEDLSKAADDEIQRASGLTAACESAVKESYEQIKKSADERKKGATDDVGQYAKGAKGAGKVADANAKKSGSMETAGGDQSAKKEGQEQKGGGGGGMPNLPQIPQPPKEKPQKSAAQLLQEQQAARTQQCQQLFTAYNTGVSTCDGQHPCHPEVGRVKDVCDAYNSCIAALAPFPSDCANPPNRAVAK